MSASQEATALSNSAIEAAYRERTRKSAARATEARGIFPSGLVHDARRIEPYPIYVERAEGSHKWDIDGNEYIDYYGGHGALILGHRYPAVAEAVHRQVDLGTHYAACHELEVRWGTLVKELVPCAERVRFTSSGTEANLMALRLARAFTGRPKIFRMMGHFHGWQDHTTSGYDSHFDGTPTPGVLPGVAEGVLLAPPDDAEAGIALLEAHDDVAAVILEPTGGNFGLVPIRREYVEALRRVTAERGVLLIFDEVVTGFRVSRHGAQGYYGITPDLATFAKILAGGLPGGAVTGREDVLSLLDFDVAKARGVEKVGHQGTFNANPVCAASGIAALEVIAREDVCEHASAQAAKLRGAVNRVFAAEGMPWAAYGEHSAMYVFTNGGGLDIDPEDFDPHAIGFEGLKAPGHPAANRFRLALMVNGVDVSGKPGALLSYVHSDDDLERTVEAVRASVRMLKAEGEFA